MTTQKSLGQIAYEASPRAMAGNDWRFMSEERKSMRERIAAAVALECPRVCSEIAKGHMLDALGGDSKSAAAYQQQAALECHAAILGTLK